MQGTMAQDRHGNKLQGFVATEGRVLTEGAGLTYTPEYGEIVMFANDVTVTLDGVPMAFTAGDLYGFAAKNVYTLSVATSVHVM